MWHSLLLHPARPVRRPSTCSAHSSRGPLRLQCAPPSAELATPPSSPVPCRGRARFVGGGDVYGHRPEAQGGQTEVSALQNVRGRDQSARRMEPWAGRSKAQLVQTPRRDAARELEMMGISDRLIDDAPDLGDLVVVLLAGTLARLRDRLEADGFSPPAELVADLVEIADDYLTSAAV